MTPQEAFKAWSASLDQNLFSHAPEDMPLLEQAFLAGANWSGAFGERLVTLANTYPPSESDQADAVYSAFPRKEAKRAAIKAILAAHKRLGNEGPGHLRMHGSAAWDYLLKKTKQYAEAVAKWPEYDREHFIPMPTTFFNQDRFNDVPSSWERKPLPGRFATPTPQIRIRTD